MPSRADLDAALARYPTALSLRAKASKQSAGLVDLDAWYRGELREVVAERKKEDTGGEAELTREELGKLMLWKLARGKFRPRLHDLVLSNPSSLVQSTTSSASTASPSGALAQLSTLKGVGPATASAVLALWHPDSEPFMSDEALENCECYEEGEEGRGKRDYTVKAWREFRTKMLERKEKEGWESVEELEKALWAWAVLRKYGTEEEETGEGEEEEKREEKRKKGKKRTSAAADKEPSKPASKKRKST
ncbi:hypothetical protein JCM8097_007346 [Rhodosporidiobolus ruineniae]